MAVKDTERMESEIIKGHPSLERAIDIALWMEFKYRTEQRKYVVVWDKKTKRYMIAAKKVAKRASCTKKPQHYAAMSYEQIRDIRMEYDPLPHWEEIMGLFSGADGEILRFILHYEVPIERIIRYELACRGYDKNCQWVGFDKAHKIWLTDKNNENENRTG